MERSKWRSLCKTSIQQFESDRIRALEAKREQRKTATIRSAAPHATHAKSVDKHVRRELGYTPTLERINTDYDPGSVVSTAQSNNLLAYLLIVGRSRCSLRTVSISASQRAPRASCRSRLGTYQKHTFRYSGYSGSSNNNITTLSLVSRSYFSRYFTTRVDSDFYPRDAVLARVLAMAPCPRVCLSVTSRCSIEVVGRIELVSGMEAAFDQTYTVF